MPLNIDINICIRIDKNKQTYLSSVCSRALLRFKVYGDGDYWEKNKNSERYQLYSLSSSNYFL